MRTPFIFEEFGNQSLSHELTAGGMPTGIVITDQQVGPAQKLSNEEIVSRDIGYYGRFFNNDLLFDARIYRDTLSHLINPVTMPAANDAVDGTTRILFNEGSTNVTGIEAEADYTIDPSLRIIASASFVDISNNGTIDKGITDSLTHSAPHSATSILAIDHFNELYSGSVGYYYVGRFSWTDASSANSNNYQTLDLKLSRKIPMHGSKASASIVLKNLLGKYSNYDKNPDNGPLIVQDLTAYLEFKIQIK
jgi:outer membrane receptor protein involved in Fe transport